jgi:hypothetical protein
LARGLNYSTVGAAYCDRFGSQVKLKLLHNQMTALSKLYFLLNQRSLGKGLAQIAFIIWVIKLVTHKIICSHNDIIETIFSIE